MDTVRVCLLFFCSIRDWAQISSGHQVLGNKLIIFLKRNREILLTLKNPLLSKETRAFEKVVLKLERILGNQIWYVDSWSCCLTLP